MKLPRRPIRFLAISLAVFVVLASTWLYLLDPLDWLAFRLSIPANGADGWQAGFSVYTDDPPSAKPEAVLAHYLNNQRGQILELKRITIWDPAPHDHRYWAALVRTKTGDVQTLVFQYQPGSNGFHPHSSGSWWMKQITD